MAKNKDDVTVAYKHGTPLEAGKIADSEPVDVFSSAHNIPKSDQTTTDSSTNDQSQMQRDPQEGASTDFTTGAPRLPQKGPPPTMCHKF
ncbi:seed maturation protein [Spatholobus suberectus]|nr:seed maturation protein [Spatholobus suberectus]